MICLTSFIMERFSDLGHHVSGIFETVSLQFIVQLNPFVTKQQFDVSMSQEDGFHPMV